MMLILMHRWRDYHAPPEISSERYGTQIVLETVVLVAFGLMTTSLTNPKNVFPLILFLSATAPATTSICTPFAVTPPLMRLPVMLFLSIWLHPLPVLFRYTP